MNGMGHGVAIYPVSKNTTRAHISEDLCQGVFGSAFPGPNVLCNVENATAALPYTITDGDGQVVIDIAEFPTQRQVDSTPGQLFSAGGLPGVLLTGLTLTTRGPAGKDSICGGRQVSRHLHQPGPFPERLDVRFRERQVAVSGGFMRSIRGVRSLSLPAMVLVLCVAWFPAPQANNQGANEGSISSPRIGRTQADLGICSNCEDIYGMSPDGSHAKRLHTWWRGRRRSARLQQRRRRLVHSKKLIAFQSNRITSFRRSS